MIYIGEGRIVDAVPRTDAAYARRHGGDTEDRSAVGGFEVYDPSAGTHAWWPRGEFLESFRALTDAECEIMGQDVRVGGDPGCC